MGESSEGEVERRMGKELCSQSRVAMCRATQKQARAYPRTPAQLQYSRPRAWVEREEKRMAKALVRSLGQGLRASPFSLRASA